MKLKPQTKISNLSITKSDRRDLHLCMLIHKEKLADQSQQFEVRKRWIWIQHVEIFFLFLIRAFHQVLFSENILIFLKILEILFFMENAQIVKIKLFNHCEVSNFMFKLSHENQENKEVILIIELAHQCKLAVSALGPALKSTHTGQLFHWLPQEAQLYLLYKSNNIPIEFHWKLSSRCDSFPGPRPLGHSSQFSSASFI